jgi:DNA-binding protein HU-beta
MEGNMNKEGLVTAVAEELGLSKTEAAKSVSAIFSQIEKSLAKGEEVNLPGFGKFGVANRAARKGKNPQTGAPIEIEAKTAPIFKAGATLKKVVASGEKG